MYRFPFVAASSTTKKGRNNKVQIKIHIKKHPLTYKISWNNFNETILNKLLPLTQLNQHEDYKDLMSFISTACTEMPNVVKIPLIIFF